MERNYITKRKLEDPQSANTIIGMNLFEGLNKAKIITEALSIPQIDTILKANDSHLFETL